MTEVQHVFISNGIDPNSIQTVEGFLAKLLEEIARGDAVIASLEPSSTKTVEFSWNTILATITVSVNAEGDDAAITIGGDADLVSIVNPLGRGGIAFHQIPVSATIALSDKLYFTFLEMRKGQMMIRNVFFIDDERGNFSRTFKKIVRKSNMN